MLKFARYFVISLLLCAAGAPQMFAQRHPLPTSKNEPAVICRGCGGTNSVGQANEGLPTYPYSGALVKYVGRYVDSASTPSTRSGYRTARARFIETAPSRRGNAPPRVYIQIGNGIGAYSLDSFFSTRLPGGTIPISDLFKAVSYDASWGRNPVEQILNWDSFIYAEAGGSGWQTPGGDFQDYMGLSRPVDYDDRGYVYVASNRYGWGIVTDAGSNDGAQMTKVVQMLPSPDSRSKLDSTGVTAHAIIAVKVGTKYYAVVADDTSQAVWDVTTPATPKLVSPVDAKTGRTTLTGSRYGIQRADRFEGTNRVAIVHSDGVLRVYDADDLIAAGAPLAQQAGTRGFSEVSFDESGTVWAVENKADIWRLTPSGSTYSAQSFASLGDFTALLFHAHAGYIAVGGIDWSASGFPYDVKLFRTESAGPKAVDVDGFFRKYYHAAPAGYAQPGTYTAIQSQSADLQIVKWGGKTYLMYSGFGLGDVFELEGGDSINVTVKNNFGTVNPNAKPTQAGPFYGDVVNFVAQSSKSDVAYSVLWNFGNPESGSANTGSSRTGEEARHQYTGLTTAAAISTPKVVKAQTVQNPNIATQHNLTLKVPVSRIGVVGSTVAYAANTNSLDVVAGDQFTDASDGAVEGHYASWSLDGAAAVKQRPDQPFSAGALGAHTLQLQGAYGVYDANFNNAAPYLTSAVSVGYTVRPFLVTINAPTASGTNVQFTATPRVTQQAGIVTATNWTVNWLLNGSPVGASSVGTNAAQVVPVGTIPAVSIPKAQLVDGAVVSLQVTIDTAGLSAAAAPYATFTASSTMSTPDPLIEVTGCENANGPCKFTAKSVSGKSQAGWTYLWTLTRPTGQPLTGTNAVFEPGITASGSYTITLKATKDIFEQVVDKNLTVAGSLCGPLPSGLDTTIQKDACLSACAPGTTVNFSVSFRGYSRQACDTYLWTLPDGTTASTETVSFTFQSAGTHTISVRISNAGTPQPLNETTTVSISGGSGPTDPSPTCTKPTVASFTYAGSPSGCATGGNCRTTDNITFSARRGTQSLQTCDSVSWDFGDGVANTSRTPTKTFSTAGTYPVKLTVTNSNGSAEVTQTVTIVNPPTGSCNTPPQPSNFVITYVGQQSNCSEGNPGNCRSGESIRFEAVNYFYLVGSCDNFEWDFGDGTKSTERTPTHVFSGSQTSYTVKLKVSNSAGFYTYSRNVTFANSAPTKPVPTISYSVFPTTGRKGQAVTFTATSSMATTTGWTWNFGDGTAPNTTQAGTTAQSSTITYTFTKAGTFTVRATARNSDDAATAPTNTAQAQIVVSEPPAIPEYKFLLPVTAYTAGQGGSAWRTDVQIYHSDPEVSAAKPLVMDALFKGTTKTLTVSKATTIYENFLGNLLALQREDQGPVIITTKSTATPPQIWTRTYTQTAHGTFGQFIPAIRIDNVGGGAAAGDGKYYMSGLRHDNRYRTNVGFLNPNAAAITATVTVYDERRLKVGEFPLTLQPFALDQFTLKNKVTNLPDDKPFSLKIEVPAGNWLVAYASYIDGFSNDPVFIQALPESAVTSADYKTNVIPGVGHTGQWRSDVTILNPDIDAVQFDLQYFNSAGEKKGEALGVVLDGGKFLQYGDILKQGVLGNVDDGLGTLKLLVKSSHEKYPMTFARTYFDNGGDGTYGQGIAGFAAARANVKANKPAVIAGVRNTDLYYTNIGLVNVSDAPVTAKVTLLDPNTGAAVTSIDYTINPNQTILGRFNGFGAITQGTLKIEANGNLWAFASIIDQLTKDPEYVPALSLQ